MKEKYFNELTELFSNSNFDKQLYEQIIDKYSSWYDKLLEEGKSDEEIQVLLKSPSEVVELFNQKYKTINHTTPETDSDEIVTESTTEQDSTVEDSTPIDDSVIENATTKDTVENTYNPDLDPNVIVRTNSKGKAKYYKKRSFMSGLGVFFLLALVSVFVFPALLSVFSMFLSTSIVSLTLVFMPIQYIMFINRSGVISYVTPEGIQSYLTAHNVGPVTLPNGFVDSVNNFISQLNQHSHFEFGVFLHTIFTGVFAFASFILFLYLTVQSFKLIIKYFSMVIDKIRFRKVDL